MGGAGATALVTPGAAHAAWRAAHSVTPNPQQFTKEIWPFIRELPVAILMHASGLSDKMCLRIRRGVGTPHPMHWEALRALARTCGEEKTRGATI